MASNRGLPPLFGAPWEREEQEVLAARRHGMTFALTDAGESELRRLRRVVQFDDRGMVQIAGTDEEATRLRVLEAVDEATLQQYLDTPVIGPIVRRQLIGLFEAGYVKSHSWRDI